jgi:hypothetical protein
MTIVPISVRARAVGLHRAIVNPLLGARTVLTKEPWEFVSLWLRRNKRDAALFYWEQAREFHNASKGLPPQSRPLLLYYSYMNAAKALFTSKKTSFNEYHGIQRHLMRQATGRIRLGNEGIRILTNGVLPALSTYYNELERTKSHSMQELLFNTVFVHRTYCLTNERQTEMFVPVKDCRYVLDSISRRAFFQARLAKHSSSQRVMNRLPPSLMADPDHGEYAIRSATSVPCSRPKSPTPSDLANLSTLNQELRADLQYIRGTEALWYVKTIVAGTRRLARQTPTVVLAAMHRLSEICRYRPLELRSFLSGRENWLISEFVAESPQQFIDAIASEITGLEFLDPNVRPAS